MTHGFNPNDEMEIIRVHTRKLTLVSAGIHMMLFLWMMLFKTFSPEEPGLTEITWIEPAEAKPAARPNMMARSLESAGRGVTNQNASPRAQELVRTPTPLADMSPNPQQFAVTQSRLSERLANLQREQTDPAPIAALTTPSPVGRNQLAGVSNNQNPAKEPKSLTRTQTKQSTPIQLRRTSSVPNRAAIVSSPVTDINVERAKPKNTESTAERTLAGAKMTGPVADRPIISYTTPVYPEWAKLEAVEGSVTIYFVVLPEGTVKENVMVERTSGFSDFDNNAIEALRTWRFEPLKGGAGGEQWGTITFNYRLSD